ncbi:MAG TPA: acetyl-CoA C-acetyltransferase [Solirubrobacteraceae bacterium]|nr:acetyl-CoA C-acetyltransferase [Solirubrobacteraceae bacterium]HME04842.1 acetyl-CoA C-acetyltransferase [Solirubrobacteraceae bacterium]
MLPAPRDAVVCEPLRTPVGRFGGVFRDVPAASLAARVIEAIVERTGLRVEDVEDVIMGQCYPNGEAPAIGRVAALDAGLPVEVPGMQVDRRCGSALQAVINGCLQVQTGAAELVLAGGVESMSQVELYSTGLRWGVRSGGARLDDRLARARVTAGGSKHPVPGGMLETAENVRRDYGVSRERQDELALRSHELAIAAHREGRFAAELVPVTVGDRVIDVDEHPRADASLEALARLRPVMGREDPDATVTAGNASGQNDGAAICIVTHAAKAQELGLRPMGRLVSWAVAGVAPETMGIGPVPSTELALARGGLALDDLDLIELNEAFASQVLAVLGHWRLEDGLERVNVNGSGISLGHPVGATGARILATLLHEMDRREARYGLETMCIGGGQGLAAVFERPSS